MGAHFQYNVLGLARLMMVVAGEEVMLQAESGSVQAKREGGFFQYII